MRALRDAAVIGQRGETHSLTAAVLAVILTPPTSLPPRLDSANFARTPTPKRALRDAVVTGRRRVASAVSAAATPLRPVFAAHVDTAAALRGTAPSPANPRRLSRHCSRPRRHSNALDANESGAGLSRARRADARARTRRLSAHLVGEARLPRRSRRAPEPLDAHGAQRARSIERISQSNAIRAEAGWNCGLVLCSARKLVNRDALAAKQTGAE